ncbi:unnamed protein product, partial [Gulo gulo]
MKSLMLNQLRPVTKGLPTLLACIGFFTRMNSIMYFKMGDPVEGLATFLTLIG